MCLANIFCTRYCGILDKMVGNLHEIFPFIVTVDVAIDPLSDNRTGTRSREYEDGDFCSDTRDH